MNWVTQQDDRAPGGALTVSYASAYDANGNRTQETETRPGKPNRVTSYTYNKANWLVATTDPGGGTTVYNYDAAGNQTSITDPSGYSTSVTPNALNQPHITTHRDASNNVVATTTNTYEARGLLQGWTTVDTPNTLTLTTTLDYNANGYLNRADIQHRGTTFSAALTSTVAYHDNNLVRASVLPTIGEPGERQVAYDSAGRVICSISYTRFGNTIPADAYLEYDVSGRRIRRYWALASGSTCVPLYIRGYSNLTTYTYDGNRLIAEETGGGYTRTLSYDSDGNVAQMHQIDYAQRVTVTLSYGWEAGTHRLTTFTRTVNSNVTYTATLEYDRLERIRRFCSSAAGCSNLTYLGESNWLATIRDASGVVRQRYQYANGRPLRVEIDGAPYYYRYDWHGNVAGRVAANGDGGNVWQSYGAWGDLGNGFGAQYYNWNGAWGYMRFPNPFNFDLHDHLDQGLYYVQGRWYNQDTGLWLSPDANGSYIYYDNDPVNKPHRLNAPFIQTGLPHIVNPSCRQTLPGVHPVVNYICDEMVTNASGQYARQMRQLNTRCFACAWEGMPLGWPGVAEARNNALLADAEARAAAYALWGWLVRHGGPWDHKSEIRQREIAVGRDPDWQRVSDWEYSFDTWSNIHYGYVGVAAGFLADALLEGAGLEQIGSDILAYRKSPQVVPGVSGWRRFDESSDQAGIKIGINLWNTCHLALKPEDIVRAIQSMPGLNRQPARGGHP